MQAPLRSPTICTAPTTNTMESEAMAAGWNSREKGVNAGSANQASPASPSNDTMPRARESP